MPLQGTRVISPHVSNGRARQLRSSCTPRGSRAELRCFLHRCSSWGHAGALVAAPQGPEVPACPARGQDPGQEEGSAQPGSDCPGARPPEAAAFLSGPTSHLEQPQGAAAAARPPSSRWPENGLRGLCFSGREPRPVRGVHVLGGGPSCLRSG